MTAKRLLYVLNDAPFFISHRLDLALAAKAAGYEVHVSCPPSPAVETISNYGFIMHSIRLDRHGMNLWNDLKTIIDLVKLYKKIRPNLVHLLTIKPIIYGGIAAQITKTQNVVFAPTGLGYTFIRSGFKGRIVNFFIKRLYRTALGSKNSIGIFQNNDDKNTFLNNRIINHNNIEIIKGSGVDINHFIPLSEPDGIPTIILPARMLLDKGIYEFVEAAALLKKANVQGRFVLVGDIDPGNPASIPVDQLRAWNDSKVIEWWGFQNDMLDVYRKAHIVCLPSYREGLPKALLEAAACAKSIVTTDAPGCREIVLANENGFLVPIKNAQALAQALAKLISDKYLRNSMGQRSREIVEKDFSLDTIIEQTLFLYQRTLDKNVICSTLNTSLQNN